jgi:hypothetical protein
MGRTESQATDTFDRGPRVASKTLRLEVFARDGWRCLACGTHERLTADHILPWSLGGPTSPDNLRCLCLWCNCISHARQLTLGDIRRRRVELTAPSQLKTWDELRGRRRVMQIEDVRYLLGELLAHPLLVSVACRTVLEEAQEPLSALEVAERAYGRRLLSPRVKNVAQSCSSELAKAAKDPNSRVIRCSRGIYGIAGRDRVIALETEPPAESSPAKANRPQARTWAEAAQFILLAAGGPLPIKTIAERSLNSGLVETSAAKPVDSLKYELAKEARRPNGLFMRTAPSTYALRGA